MAKAMTDRELNIVATDAVRAMGGDDKSIMLGAHIVRLLIEIKRLRDAEKAKSKRSPKTRKVSSYAKSIWDAQDESETVNENCPRNAKGCRCRITENACKAFDYYDGRQG